MKWPLQREAHTRQDKIRNPDYREELALEGDDFDRGGNEPAKQRRLITFKGNTIYLNINLPEYKTDPQRHLEHILRRESIFSINGYVSGLSWGKKAFRKHNKIQAKIGDQIFDEIKDELEELFRITVKNLRRVERETGYTEILRDGVKKNCYQFKSGFVPVKIGSLETKKFILEIDFINAK